VKIISPKEIRKTEINVARKPPLQVNELINIVKKHISNVGCADKFFVNNVDADLVKSLSIRENKVEITIFRTNYC